MPIQTLSEPYNWRTFTVTELKTVLENEVGDGNWQKAKRKDDLVVTCCSVLTRDKATEWEKKFKDKSNRRVPGLAANIGLRPTGVPAVAATSTAISPVNPESSSPQAEHSADDHASKPSRKTALRASRRTAPEGGAPSTRQSSVVASKSTSSRHAMLSRIPAGAADSADHSDSPSASMLTPMLAIRPPSLGRSANHQRKTAANGSAPALSATPGIAPTAAAACSVSTRRQKRAAAATMKAVAEEDQVDSATGHVASTTSTKKPTRNTSTVITVVARRTRSQKQTDPKARTTSPPVTEEPTAAGGAPKRVTRLRSAATAGQDKDPDGPQGNRRDNRQLALHDSSASGNDSPASSFTDSHTASQPNRGDSDPLNASQAARVQLQARQRQSLGIDLRVFDSEDEADMTSGSSLSSSESPSLLDKKHLTSNNSPLAVDKESAPFSPAIHSPVAVVSVSPGGMPTTGSQMMRLGHSYKPPSGTTVSLLRGSSVDPGPILPQSASQRLKLPVTLEEREAESAIRVNKMVEIERLGEILDASMRHIPQIGLGINNDESEHSGLLDVDNDPVREHPIGMEAASDQDDDITRHQDGEYREGAKQTRCRPVTAAASLGQQHGPPQLAASPQYNDSPSTRNPVVLQGKMTKTTATPASKARASTKAAVTSKTIASSITVPYPLGKPGDKRAISAAARKAALHLKTSSGSISSKEGAVAIGSGPWRRPQRGATAADGPVAADDVASGNPSLCGSPPDAPRGGAIRPITSAAIRGSPPRSGIPGAGGPRPRSAQPLVARVQSSASPLNNARRYPGGSQATSSAICTSSTSGGQSPPQAAPGQRQTAAMGRPDPRSSVSVVDAAPGRSSSPGHSSAASQPIVQGWFSSEPSSTASSLAEVSHIINRVRGLSIASGEAAVKGRIRDQISSQTSTGGIRAGVGFRRDTTAAVHCHASTSNQRSLGGKSPLNHESLAVRVSAMSSQPRFMRPKLPEGRNELGGNDMSSNTREAQGDRMSGQNSPQPTAESTTIASGISRVFARDENVPPNLQSSTRPPKLNLDRVSRMSADVNGSAATFLLNSFRPLMNRVAETGILGWPRWVVIAIGVVLISLLIATTKVSDGLAAVVPSLTMSSSHPANSHLVFCDSSSQSEMAISGRLFGKGTESTMDSKHCTAVCPDGGVCQFGRLKCPKFTRARRRILGRWRCDSVKTQLTRHAQSVLDLIGLQLETLEERHLCREVSDPWRDLFDLIDENFPDAGSPLVVTVDHENIIQHSVEDLKTEVSEILQEGLLQDDGKLKKLGLERRQFKLKSQRSRSGKCRRSHRNPALLFGVILICIGLPSVALVWKSHCRKRALDNFIKIAIAEKTVITDDGYGSGPSVNELAEAALSGAGHLGLQGYVRKSIVLDACRRIADVDSDIIETRLRDSDESAFFSRSAAVAVMQQTTAAG